MTLPLAMATVSLVKLIIERLSSLDELATVGGLIDIDDASDDRQLPAASVYQSSRRATDNTALNGVSQQREITVNVVLTTAYNTATERAAEEIDALLEKVDAKLIGWIPSDKWSPLLAGSGQISKVASGHVTRVESYTTSELIRK